MCNAGYGVIFMMVISIMLTQKFNDVQEGYYVWASFSIICPNKHEVSMFKIDTRFPFYFTENSSLVKCKEYFSRL